MTTWLSGISKQHRTIRRNAFAWCGIFFLLFALMLVRLFWLQVVDATRFQKLAELYHTRDVTLRATRGRILDRNHVVLALDDQRQSLYADPTLVPDGYAPYYAKYLAPVIKRSEQEIVADLTRQLTFIWVKRDLSPAQKRALEARRLPGIMIKEDGPRFRIGFDVAKLPRTAGVADQIGETLGITPDTVKSRLGLTDAQPDDPHAEKPSDVRWLGGTYNQRQTAALKGLKYDGLQTTVAGTNYSLGANPSLFLDDATKLSAEWTARQVADILNADEDRIVARLRTRPRFTLLKRNLSLTMAKELTRLQGTLFVVEPGKLYDDAACEPNTTAREREQEAITRLSAMLNGKDPKTPLVTPEEIRQALQPGAAAGPLRVKLVDEKPSVDITRRLFAKPIPGVIYGLPGVGVQSERRRRYPFNTLAAATLGFVSYERDTERGVFGLEATQEDTLHGVNGSERKEIDARHITIPERSKRQEPVDGRDVILTIDTDIQQAVEEELAKAVQSARAHAGYSVVLDPKTGEILAMANYPSWDANDPGHSQVPLVNPVVSNFYEPGSTFKYVSVLAALEEGVTHDGDTVTFCSGAMPVGRNVIHEAHNAHHAVDAERLMEQSCNIGAAVLSLKLGPERFLHWCDALGFGKPTGIEIRNESPGSLNRRNARSARITLANMGFGQSLAVTPIQMAAAYAVSANGGEWVQPHLIKSRVTLDPQTKQARVENITVPRRRVCSPETARLMLGYLEDVCVNGTGGSARIPGYRVGGKTGTAQKPGPNGFRSGMYIGSFIGVMPINDPRLVIVSVIDEPHASIYGGVVAAPVVKEVGRRALQYLNIPPTEPVTGESSRP